MNLHGLRVLNTRPLDQGLLLNQAIEKAGGISITLPALTIEPTANDWLKNLPSLASVNQAIFISTNAINYFYTELEQQQLIWPSTIQTTAIGKTSANALAGWNIRVDCVPAVADSKHLLQLNLLQYVKDQIILLVKGEGGNPDIANTLLTRGANLISLDVYRRNLPSINHQYIDALWRDDAVDIILFTSQQSIQNIFTLFREHGRSWLCKTPCIVISERLAEAARLLGMQTIMVNCYDTILNMLEKYSQQLHR